MNTIWNLIDQTKFNQKTKRILFLTALMLMNAVIGGLVWALAGRVFLPDTEWMLCFIGYPAILVGGFGGILYIYKHL